MNEKDPAVVAAEEIVEDFAITGINADGAIVDIIRSAYAEQTAELERLRAELPLVHCVKDSPDCPAAGCPCSRCAIVRLHQRVSDLESGLACANERWTTAAGERDKLRAELADRQKTVALAGRGDVGVWMWQGDGEDHVESLTCPILMSADAMRRLREELAEAKAKACQHTTEPLTYLEESNIRSVLFGQHDWKSEAYLRERERLVGTIREIVARRIRQKGSYDRAVEDFAEAREDDARRIRPACQHVTLAEAIGGRIEELLSAYHKAIHPNDWYNPNTSESREVEKGLRAVLSRIAAEPKPMTLAEAMGEKLPELVEAYLGVIVRHVMSDTQGWRDACTEGLRAVLSRIAAEPKRGKMNTVELNGLSSRITEWAKSYTFSLEDNAIVPGEETKRRAEAVANYVNALLVGEEAQS